MFYGRQYNYYLSLLLLLSLLLCFVITSTASQKECNNEPELWKSIKNKEQNTVIILVKFVTNEGRGTEDVVDFYKNVILTAYRQELLMREIQLCVINENVMSTSKKLKSFFASSKVSTPNSIVELYLVPKHEESSECLSQPSQIEKLPQPLLYDKKQKNKDKDDLIHWLNDITHFERTQNGEPTKKGRIQKNILSSLYQIESNFQKCEEVSPESLNDQLFFKDYVSKSKPVIIRNGINHWPAMRLWTNSYLDEKFGDLQVNIKVSSADGQFEGVESADIWPNNSRWRVPIFQNL